MEALRAVLAEVRAIFGPPEPVRIPENLDAAEVALCERIVAEGVLAEVEDAIRRCG